MRSPVHSGLALSVIPPFVIVDEGRRSGSRVLQHFLRQSNTSFTFSPGYFSMLLEDPSTRRKKQVSEKSVRQTWASAHPSNPLSRNDLTPLSLFRVVFCLTRAFTTGYGQVQTIASVYKAYTAFQAGDRGFAPPSQPLKFVIILLFAKAIP